MHLFIYTCIYLCILSTKRCILKHLLLPNLLRMIVLQSGCKLTFVLHWKKSNQQYTLLFNQQKTLGEKDKFYHKFSFWISRIRRTGRNMMKHKRLSQEEFTLAKTNTGVFVWKYTDRKGKGQLLLLLQCNITSTSKITIYISSDKTLFIFVQLTVFISNELKVWIKSWNMDVLCCVVSRVKAETKKWGRWGKLAPFACPGFVSGKCLSTAFDLG